MAAGTPIVCSDIHGYKGVVKRGEQALLVPPGDPRPLAEAILRLLADPELRERMGASGLERVAGVQLGRGSPPGSRPTTGSSIRRLAAQGTLPPRLPGRRARRTRAAARLTPAPRRP